jgi:hypothetical protein
MCIKVYYDACLNNEKHYVFTNKNGTNISKVLSNDLSWIGKIDYFPQEGYENADSILSHQAIFEKTGKQIIMPKALSNMVMYQVSSKEKQVVDLPALRYARIYCFVNGQKAVMKPSKRGCVACVLSKEKNEIKVTYHPSIFYFLFLVLSAGTWMFLLIRWILKFFVRITLKERVGVYW